MAALRNISFDESSMTPRTKELLILSGFMLMTVLLRLFFLYEPFERDEGMYAYFGQEILRGAIPYRDMIDHKPPGIYYIYALIIAIAGPTTEGIRIATALYASLTTAAVYQVSRISAGRLAAQISAFLYAIFSGLPLLQGSSSNSEVFMVLPAVLAVYFYIRFVDTERRLFLCASGLSIVVAMLIKTVALPVAILIFLFVLIVPPKKCIKERCLDILAFVAPPLILVVTILAYFNYYNALYDYYYWNYTFNTKYGALSFNQRYQHFRNALDDIAEHGVLWLIAIPSCIWMIFIKRTRTAILLGLLVPVSFLGLSLPGYYFPHYFIQLISPFVIVSGVALAALYECNKSIFRIVFYCMAVISCLLWCYYDYPLYFQYSANGVSIDKYGTIFVDAENVAKYVKKNVKPNDYIFQLGFEPELYFLTGTRAPNKFTIHIFIKDENNSELYQSLISKKPIFIIVETIRPLPGLSVVEKVINQNYYLEKKTRYFSVWHINK
jgi:4-amino-4-deoxy-L-arabinose transferase-like glycosyltransferase